MISYDRKPYYDRQKEPYDDPEWVEAENADEKPQYYWQYMYGGGKCIKKYKPSVAELYAKRTGLKIVLINDGEAEC